MLSLGLMIHARWGNVITPQESGEFRRRVPVKLQGGPTREESKRNLDGGLLQWGSTAPPRNLLASVAFPAAVAVGAAAIATLSTYLVTAPVSQAQTTAVDFPRAAAIFQRSCIGCHDGGGNVLQPGATLFSEDLERNGIGKVDEIYNITYNGKARMPGFGEKCTPRGQCTFGPRLQDEEIELLAKFVKLQADRGWPKIESYVE